MALSPEEKARRARERMIEHAKQYGASRYAKKFVATDFQSMIRAESAVDPRRYVTAVVDGEIRQVERRIGQCVCVTCGKVGPWKGEYVGGGSIQAGHFLASRRLSILFEETNCHPQCSACNGPKSGEQRLYTMWMEYMHGQEEIDRLERLKNEVVQFDLDQVVDKRIAFKARLKTAIAQMADAQMKGEYRG